MVSIVIVTQPFGIAKFVLCARAGRDGVAAGVSVHARGQGPPIGGAGRAFDIGEGFRGARGVLVGASDVVARLLESSHANPN